MTIKKHQNYGYYSRPDSEINIELDARDNNKDRMYGMHRDKFYETFLTTHYISKTKEEFASGLVNKIKEYFNPCSVAFENENINITVVTWRFVYDLNAVYTEEYSMSLYEVFNNTDVYHKFLAKLRKRGIHLSALPREAKYDKLKHMHKHREAV